MKRILASILLVAGMLSFASPAFGAEATAPASAPSTAAAVKATSAVPANVDVQLWTEDGGQSSIIVVGAVPTSTPLPATISLPLPKGAVVQWGGEIFDDSADDTPRTPTLSADGLSITVTTLKSRMVQYEAQLAPFTDKGGRRYAKLAWVQTVPAGEVQFSVKLPAASDDVRISPKPVGSPLVNGSGEKLYQLPSMKLDRGGKLDVSADYVPSYPELEKTSKSAFDYLLPAILGLLAVAVTALVVVARRSRPSASAETDGDEDDELFAG